MRVDRVKSSARAAQAIDSVPAVYHARSRNPSSHGRFRGLYDGVISIYPYQRKKVRSNVENRSNSARSVRHRTPQWRVRRRSVTMRTWTMRTPLRPPTTASQASSATCRRPDRSTAAPAAEEQRPHGRRGPTGPVHPHRPTGRPAAARPQSRPPRHPRRPRPRAPSRAPPTPPRPPRHRAPAGRRRIPTRLPRHRCRRSSRSPTERSAPEPSCCAGSCVDSPATETCFRDSARRGRAACNRLCTAELAVPCARRDGGTTVTDPEEPVTGANRTAFGP